MDGVLLPLYHQYRRGIFCLVAVGVQGRQLSEPYVQAHIPADTGHILHDYHPQHPVPILQDSVAVSAHTIHPHAGHSDFCRTDHQRRQPLAQYLRTEFSAIRDSQGHYGACHGADIQRIADRKRRRQDCLQVGDGALDADAAAHLWRESLYGGAAIPGHRHDDVRRPHALLPAGQAAGCGHPAGRGGHILHHGVRQGRQ